MIIDAYQAYDNRYLDMTEVRDENTFKLLGWITPSPNGRVLRLAHTPRLGAVFSKGVGSKSATHVKHITFTPDYINHIKHGYDYKQNHYRIWLTTEEQWDEYMRSLNYDYYRRGDV